MEDRFIKFMSFFEFEDRQQNKLINKQSDNQKSDNQKSIDAFLCKLREYG